MSSNNHNADSKMNLRQGTKKDYAKLVNGVDGTLVKSPENHNGACVGTRKQQQQQQKRADEDLENGELSPVVDEYDADGSCSEIVGSERFSDSESDEEIREAEARLQLMKKQHKVLKKQEKRARIAEETAEVEKALKNLRKGKQTKNDVTVASLRSMGDVVNQVDRLMDKNLSFKNKTGSSSDSEEESSSDVVAAGKRSS